MIRILLQLLFFSIFYTSFAQDTVNLYLDSNYLNTDKSKANIHRRAIIKDKRYYISDQYMDDRMLFTGEFSTLTPWTEDGNFQYFNEFGKLYSSGNYINGKISGKWIYYSNDNIDSIDYQYVEKYLKLLNDSASNYQRNLSNNDSSNANVEIKESLINFLQTKLHIPARAREVKDKFEFKVDLILDTNGLVKCPKISNCDNLDLNYETLRVLFLYKDTNRINNPINLTLPINFNKIEPTTEKSLWFVDENASFQGGDLNNFSNWIASNIRYPAEAALAETSGKVIVQYSIDSKGNVCDIKVIRSVNPYLDKEAIRVVSSSPQWIPAKLDGKPVKQNYVIPIVFNIQ